MNNNNSYSECRTGKRFFQDLDMCQSFTLISGVKEAMILCLTMSIRYKIGQSDSPIPSNNIIQLNYTFLYSLLST